MLGLLLLAVALAVLAGVAAVAQPHAGSVPTAALADALARNCLAVFEAPGETEALTLPDGVSISATSASCSVQAPYGALTPNTLAASGNLIGGVWTIQTANGRYITRAAITL